MRGDQVVGHLRRPIDVAWPRVPERGELVRLDISPGAAKMVENVIWELDGTFTLHLGELRQSPLERISLQALNEAGWFDPYLERPSG